jgi:hypothetical protein
MYMYNTKSVVQCNQVTIATVNHKCEWVSKWLLLNANSAIFQLYHDESKLVFNEMMMKMRSALYYTNTLSWIFIVLAHWNNSLRIDMSPHLDTLSWFRANQSFLFLRNPACLAEKQKYQFYSLRFDLITLTITLMMRLTIYKSIITK